MEEDIQEKSMKCIYCGWVGQYQECYNALEYDGRLTCPCCCIGSVIFLEEIKEKV